MIRRACILGATASLVLVALACGSSSSSDSSGAGGGGGGGDDGGGGGANADGATAAATAFTACGGKIVGADGAIDPVEYARQATLWDTSKIDCRLGPSFAAFHPGDADGARATAKVLPSQTNAKGFLCKQFQFGTVGACTGSCFGSTSGQVAYAPSDTTDPGLDRLQTYGWEDNVSCISPVHDGYLGGPHPDPGITAWAKSPAIGNTRMPNAIARTKFVETNDAIVTFTNGLVGATGTQTSGDTKPFAQLPTNKIPTAVALTTFNELALVTVWDTVAIKGQIAVFALRAHSPGAFTIPYFAVPGEGGFDTIQLLGFVDLPDMKTPTSISAAGDNGSFAGQNALQSMSQFAVPVDTLVSNIISNTGNNPVAWLGTPGKDSQYVFATAGTVMVASQWENKVTFVDLSPFFAFARKKYVDPVAQAVAAKKANDAAGVTTAEAAFNASALKTGAWPYDFTTNPEMRPVVLGTMKIAAPRAVAVGNRRASNNTKDGLPSKLLGWVAQYDGTVTAFDISSVGLPDGMGAVSPSFGEIAPVGSFSGDPNPTAMRLRGNDASVAVVSRGNRSVKIISAGQTALSATLSFRESTVDDPVDADFNVRFASGNEVGYGFLLTIADFGKKQVTTFIQNKSGCDGGAPTDACSTYQSGGSFVFPGPVYRIDTTNVN